MGVELENKEKNARTVENNSNLNKCDNGNIEKDDVLSVVICSNSSMEDPYPSKNHVTNRSGSLTNIALITDVMGSNRS